MVAQTPNSILWAPFRDIRGRQGEHTNAFPVAEVKVVGVASHESGKVEAFNKRFEAPMVLIANGSVRA